MFVVYSFVCLFVNLFTDSEETSVADHMEEDDFDWEVEQQLPTADEECQVSSFIY